LERPAGCPPGWSGFEWLLRLHERHLSDGYDPKWQRGVRHALRAEGFLIDENGVISRAHLGTGLREESVANLADASAIRPVEPQPA
jgi:hypothetical protein